MSLGKVWGKSWGIRTLGRVVGWLWGVCRVCRACIPGGRGIGVYSGSVVDHVWSMCRGDGIMWLR